MSKSFITFLTSIIALVYVFLIPPFQSPDEPNHFFRAWQVSEGHFFAEKRDARLGGILPVSLAQVCDSFSFLKNDPNARLKFSTWRNTLNIPLQSENRRFTDFANTAIYAPTAYLPQALAMAILRPLGFTPLEMLYAARIANLVAWLAFVSAALRLMPFMQRTIAALAMLPATLCMAASANADVLTNGICWWLVAAFLSGPATAGFWKKLVAIAIIALNKIIAVPLVLVGLINVGEPSNPEVPNPGNRWPFAILIFTGIMAAMLWGKFAQERFIPYDAYNPAYRDAQTLNSGVNPARQMMFVLENPMHFIHTCYTSFVDALPSMAAHFVGKFGWEKNYLPSGWLILLWIMLISLIFSEKNPLNTRQRWRMGAVVAFYFGAFALTMYALWSAVGSETMNNWQGRYFVPIAPLVALAIGQPRLEKWNRQIVFAAGIVLIGANIAMAVSIWGRYWE